MLASLESLPDELLWEIHLLSISPSLPLTSLRLHHAFYNAPPSHKASYLIQRHPRKPQVRLLAHAVRYGIFTLPVLRALERRLEASDAPSSSSQPPPPLMCSSLSQRLFRHLPSPPPLHTAFPRLYRHPPADPTELITILLTRHGAPATSADGYPLAKTVHARHEPLIDLLLSLGADPSQEEGAAVKFAVHHRDLDLVRRLVERRSTRSGKKKKRDRCALTPEMLHWAVKVGAGDIVDWMMDEKGVPPTLKTIQLLQQR